MLKRTLLCGFLELPNVQGVIARHKQNLTTEFAGKVYRFHKNCAIAGACFGGIWGIKSGIRVFTDLMLTPEPMVGSFFPEVVLFTAIIAGGVGGGCLGAAAGAAAPIALTAYTTHAIYSKARNYLAIK